MFWVVVVLVILLLFLLLVIGCNTGVAWKGWLMGLTVAILMSTLFVFLLWGAITNGGTNRIE